MNINGMGKVFALAIVLSIPLGVAQASTLDLTTAGASGFVNGAFFQQIDEQATGTGLIHSFVRMQSPGSSTIEMAYNTTVNDVLNNDSDDTHNHEVLLGDVPIVTLDGIDYRQFLLDVGEPGGGKSTVSLYDMQVFLSDTANQSVETFDANGVVELVGTMIWRIDGSGMTENIELDASLNSGNGSGDMFAYIPDSLFTGSDSQYVYLYSAFGRPCPAEGSFEEWAHLTANNVVPEPASLSLLGLGLVGMLIRSLRKRLA